MTQTFHTPSSGRVDRDTPIDFVFDGATYTGHAGDSLASALLANGVRSITSSVILHRSRGVMGSWADDATAQVGVCLLYTSPSPRDRQKSRMPSSA